MKERYSFKKLDTEKILTIVLVLFLVLWYVPFLNKGIDYTDTGFNMENYKNLFFGNGIRAIGRFYTNILGGFIYKLLPAYHLLIYRILYWILTLFTYYFAYKIFEEYLNKNIILIGLIAVSFEAKACEALFSYYPLTGFLLFLSLWLLINGASKRNKFLIFFSGFITGLNIFVRLPNVLFLCVIIALFIYFMQSGAGVKKTLAFTLWYIVGAVVTLMISLAIMIAIMGVDSVLNSFMSYIRLAVGHKMPGVENFLGIDEVERHSLFANIWTVAIQVWKSIKSLIALAPIIVICFFVYKFLNSIFPKRTKFVEKISIVVISICFSRIALFDSICHTLYLFAILSGLVILFLFWKRDPALLILNSSIILLSICLIVGSDQGLSRMRVVNPLLILMFLYNTEIIKIEYRNNNKFFNGISHVGVNSKYVLIISLIIIGFLNIFPKTYNDAMFSELNCSVNSEIKVFNGMKTSKTRAKQINEYYSVMGSAELQNKEVAIFGYFPLGVVIGNQKDYFEPVQPCIDYPGVSVTKLLKNIQTKDLDGIKPVIVVSYVHMRQIGAESFTSDAKKAVLNYMLSLYEYEKYSDSEHFTVYKPIE